MAEENMNRLISEIIYLLSVIGLVFFLKIMGCKKGEEAEKEIQERIKADEKANQEKIKLKVKLKERLDKYY